MPLIYQHQINETGRLGVWHIAEAEDFFLEKVPLQRSITHPHKRLQHLAGRCLLTALVPDFPHDLIRIADTRKPFLTNEAWHFSLSHCGDYAAAIVSQTQRVGVDVELVSDKVARVQHKFLTAEELLMLESVTDGRGSMAEGRISNADGRDPMTDDRLRDSVERPTANDQRIPNTQYPIPNTQAGQRPSAIGQRIPNTPGSQLLTVNHQLLTACWSTKEALFKWQGTGEMDFRQHLRIERLEMNGNEGKAYCRILKDGDIELTVQLLFFDGVWLSWVADNVLIS